MGVMRWVLHLPGCRSLKAKRSVVRGLRDRLVHKLRLSAAETDFHDRHAMAEICASVVAADRRHAESVLSRADSIIRSEPRAQVIESETAWY